MVGSSNRLRPLFTLVLAIVSLLTFGDATEASFNSTLLPHAVDRTAIKAERFNYSVNGEKQRSLMITSVGDIGTLDDSNTFQIAADDAEHRGAQLVLPAGSILNLRGNVYLGNLTIRAAGATINCIIDSNFHYRGTAKLRSDGCILTKAGDGAGYPHRTVSIFFDSLTINTIKSVDGVAPKSGLLLENTDKFIGSVLAGTAKGTGHSEVDPFDFRSGVQGVRIGRVRARMINQAGQGGFWIRNNSPARATANINIGSIEMDGSTADELLAIFNSQQEAADLHDIHIGAALLSSDGGCGQGLSIFRNVGDYNPGRMQGISIDRVRVNIGQIGPMLSKAPGVFAVKVQRVNARIGPIVLRYAGIWASGLPWVYGVRYAPGVGQTQPLEIPSIVITVITKNQVPTGNAAMLWGPIITRNFVVRGGGSGFRQIANGAVELNNVNAESSAFVGNPFSGSVHVNGKLNGRPI